MQDRPTKRELLDAVARFLADEIVPAMSGRRQFLARVSIHALELVSRELDGEERRFAREWRGLDAILGPEPAPEGRAALQAAIRRRTDALCARIRAGDLDRPGGARRALLEHLRESVREKLEVSDPRLLERESEGV